MRVIASKSLLASCFPACCLPMSPQSSFFSLQPDQSPCLPGAALGRPVLPLSTFFFFLDYLMHYLFRVPRVSPPSLFGGCPLIVHYHHYLFPGISFNSHIALMSFGLRNQISTRKQLKGTLFWAILKNTRFLIQSLVLNLKKFETIWLLSF